MTTALKLRVHWVASEIKKIILTTLAAAFTATLLFGCYAVIIEQSSDNLFYAMSGVYSSIMLPTSLAVLIFSGLTRMVRHDKARVKLMIDTVMLGVTVYAGLWIWAAVDVVFDYGSSSNMTFHAVKEAFDAEFRNWLPVALIVVISIPLAYRLLSVVNKKEEKMKEEHLQDQ